MIETSAGAQHVTQDDRALRQALGAGGPDVVVADDLEHGRAGEPGEQADGVDGEHQAGQHEMAAAPSRTVAHCPCSSASIVYMPVMCVGAVQRRGRAGRRRAASPPEEEQVERDERDPERRHRDAAQADDPEHLVGPAVAAHRRDDAERRRR